jgi:hypothetical protein
MKKYMYKGTWTQELEGAVEKSISKTLVEEMFYKFGLTVYARGTQNRNQSFMMTMEGMPYCEVYADTDMYGVVSYCYYSQYYAKERGSDNVDKHTLRSNKLGKLMATIEHKEALLPDAMHYLNKGILTNAYDQIRNKFKGGGRKYTGDISQLLIEKLLNLAINKTHIANSELAEAKVILDKWNAVDDNERLSMNAVKAQLGNEVYAIAETGNMGFAICSFKITEFKERFEHAYEIIKPFQRVLSLDDYEHIDEIRPVLTMYKLHLETLIERSRVKPEYLSPVMQEYFKDLGVIVAYDGYPNNPYSPLWTFIPTVLE